MDRSDPRITELIPPAIVAKEKVIWLFGRRKDYGREKYRRHYIETHAPLGLRLTRGLLGYTVNLVDKEGFPDAIVEQWVPSVLDFVTPETAYDTPEDWAQVRADYMHDRRDLFVVEEHVVRGKPLDTPLVQPTPGVKVAWLYRSGESPPPPPPADAYRVVDNRVLRNLIRNEHGLWESGPTDIALIRMAWATDIDKIGPASDGVFLTEHRFRPSPWE